MGIKTDIGYCDSTCNSVVGCNGCELWNPKKKIFICYAGRIVEHFSKGLTGARKFTDVKFHPERIEPMLAAKDLTGTRREGKPQLDGLPRLIFWNDMSDGFTPTAWKRSPFWLDVAAPKMSASPHIHQILTKRASTLVEWWKRHADAGWYFSAGWWPWWFGVSVTSTPTSKRVKTMIDGKHLVDNAKLFVSLEPVTEYVDLRPYLPALDWVIWGGESGRHAPRADLDAARRTRDDCHKAGVPFFMKQTGSAHDPDLKGKGTSYQVGDNELAQRGSIPPDLQIREIPMEGVVVEQPTQGQLWHAHSIVNKEMLSPRLANHLREDH